MATDWQMLYDNAKKSYYSAVERGSPDATIYQNAMDKYKLNLTQPAKPTMQTYNGAVSEDAYWNDLIKKPVTQTVTKPITTGTTNVTPVNNNTNAMQNYAMDTSNEQDIMNRLMSNAKVGMLAQARSKNWGTSGLSDSFTQNKIRDDINYYMPNLNDAERNALYNYLYKGDFSKLGQVEVDQNGNATFVNKPMQTTQPLQSVQAQPTQTQQVQAQQAQAQPSQAAQPTQMPMLNLRDVVSQLGLQIGNIGNIPTINGTQVNPQQFGLQLVNGRWQGTSDQIAQMLGIPTGLRQQLESQGYRVGYDNATGQVIVNDMPVNTQGMANIGGRFYSSPEQINSIISQLQANSNVGGNVGNGMQVEQGLGFTNGPELNQFDEEKIRLKNELDMVNNKLAEYEQNNPYQSNITQMIDGIRTFKSSVQDDMISLIQSTLTPFEYNPNSDTALQDAVKFADKSMLEEMNRRGILSSTITGDNARQIREELLPKYQELALQRYNENINKKLKTAEMLKSISQEDFDRYSAYATASIANLQKIDDRTRKSYENVISTISDQLKNNIAEQKNYVEAKQKEFDKALDIVDKVGYVTNEISSILKLPVGTPSWKAKEYALNQNFEIDKIKNQQEFEMQKIQAQSDNEIAKIREQQKNKNAENEQKVAKGQLLGQLSQFSADDSLNWVLQNSKELVSKLGVEYEDLIKELGNRKQQEFTNNMRIRSDNRANDAAERAAAAAERTAKAAEDKPPTTAELNQAYKQKYKEIKGLSYDDAYAYLTWEHKNDLIGVLGPQLYKSLFNEVMADAIKDGYPAKDSEGRYIFDDKGEKIKIEKIIKEPDFY
jgi:hypothetical protein